MGQKIHVETWSFEYEMKSQLLKSNFKIKIKILKLKFSCSKKVSLYLFLHTSFDVRLFLNFYFDITKSYFFNPHVNFVCMIKTISLFQKVHYVFSFLFWKTYPYFPILFSLKFIATWILKKLTTLMLNITYILVSCTININFYCDNPNNPFSCAFTPVQICKEKLLILPLDLERQKI
jgi:hypothetical protein